MCGRFTQRFSWREIHELLGLAGPAANLRPRYNVAPGQEDDPACVEPVGEALSIP